MGIEYKCEKCGDNAIPCQCVIEYRRKQERARIDMHIEELLNAKPDPDSQGMEVE